MRNILIFLLGFISFVSFGQIEQSVVGTDFFVKRYFVWQNDTINFDSIGANTIYSGDGVLTGDRLVNLDTTRTLSFYNGRVYFGDGADNFDLHSTDTTKGMFDGSQLMVIEDATGLRYGGTLSDTNGIFIVSANIGLNTNAPGHVLDVNGGGRIQDYAIIDSLEIDSNTIYRFDNSGAVVYWNESKWQVDSVLIVTDVGLGVNALTPTHDITLGGDGSISGIDTLFFTIANGKAYVSSTHLRITGQKNIEIGNYSDFATTTDYGLSVFHSRDTFNTSDMIFRVLNNTATVTPFSVRADGTIGLKEGTRVNKISAAGDVDWTSDNEIVTAAAVQAWAGNSIWHENGFKIYYNDGNVGIGYSDPDYPLQVDGQIGGQALELGDNVVGGYIDFKNALTDPYDARISLVNDSVLKVTSDYFNIGTNTVGGKLNVNGDVSIATMPVDNSNTHLVGRDAVTNKLERYLITELPFVDSTTLADSMAAVVGTVTTSEGLSGTTDIQLGAAAEGDAWFTADRYIATQGNSLTLVDTPATETIYPIILDMRGSDNNSTFGYQVKDGASTLLMGVKNGAMTVEASSTMGVTASTLYLNSTNNIRVNTTEYQLPNVGAASGNAHILWWDNSTGVPYWVDTTGLFSGGASYTASNGLTLSGSDFQLGGTISGSTEIILNDDLTFKSSTVGKRIKLVGGLGSYAAIDLQDSTSGNQFTIFTGSGGTTFGLYGTAATRDLTINYLDELFIDGLDSEEQDRILYYSTSSDEITHGAVSALPISSAAWLGSDGSAETDSTTNIHTYGAVEIRNPASEAAIFRIDTNTIAIGNGFGLGQDSSNILIGADSIGTGYGNILMGHQSSILTTGYNNVVLGRDIGVLTTGYDNVLIGNNADLTAGTFNRNVVIGYNAAGKNSSVVSIGPSSQAGSFSTSLGNNAGGSNREYSVALGNQAHNNGNASTSLGGFTDASTGSLAAGQYAQANASNTMALHRYSEVTSGSDYGMAVGFRTKSNHYMGGVIGIGPTATTYLQSIADTSLTLGIIDNNILNLTHTETSGGESNVQLPLATSDTSATRNVVMTSTGNLKWITRAAGTMYVDSNTTAQSFTDDTWQRVDAFDSSVFLEGMTFDADSNYLVVDSAGVYEVSVTIGASGTVSSQWQFAVFVDKTRQAQAATERKIGTGGDVGSAAIAQTRIYCDVGSSVALYAAPSTGNDNLTLKYGNLTLKKE